jgi:hypothetical protein
VHGQDPRAVNKAKGGVGGGVGCYVVCGWCMSGVMWGVSGVMWWVGGSLRCYVV